MKKSIHLFLIIIIVLLAGYTLLTKNKETNTTQNQAFDLNINALTYQLPDHTKICLPETRFDCSSDGCNNGKPTVFVLYDENTNKVYRCDNNPCDGFDVSEEVSGLYTNLTPITPNGSLVKLSNNNEYIEIVSLGLDFIIYRGNCTDKK